VLGSEIAGERELAQRKRKAEAAYNAKLNIWKHRRHLSEVTKMKIFKTTVQECFNTQSGAAVVIKRTERETKWTLIREAYCEDYWVSSTQIRLAIWSCYMSVLTRHPCQKPSSQTCTLEIYGSYTKTR
jgi:hypothetical protein